MSETKKKRGLWWKIPAGLFAVFIVFGIFAGGGPSSKLLAEPKSDEEAYKDAEFNHRGAVIGEYKKGQKVKFTAIVKQLIKSDTARVEIFKPKLYFTVDPGTNTMLVFADKRKVGSKDLLEVKGRYLGNQTYKNRLGGEVTVPLIQVDYYEAFEDPFSSHR